MAQEKKFNPYVTTYCGLECEDCEFIASHDCKGCIASGGNPFHGDNCVIAVCCKSKGVEHCGECPQMPCKQLTEYSCDPEYGDKPAGARIERCKMLAKIKK